MKKFICTIILLTLVIQIIAPTHADACNLPHFNTRSGTTPWVLQSGRPHFATSNSSPTSSVLRYKSTWTDQVYINRYNSLCKAGDDMWGESLFLKATSNSYVGEVTITDDLNITTNLDVNTTVNSSNHVTDWVIYVNDIVAYSRYQSEVAGTGEPRQKLSNLFATGFGLVAGLGERSNLNCVMKNRQALYSVTAGDLKGMTVVTHQHEHSNVDVLRGTYTYDSTTRHEVVCSTCLAYTYQSHFLGHCTYKNDSLHNKICACGYTIGTESHSYSYKNGSYYCIGCGHITSNPGSIS